MRRGLKTFSVNDEVLAEVKKHPDINWSRFVTDCLYELCDVLKRDTACAREYRIAYSKNPPAQRIHDLVLTRSRVPHPRPAERPLRSA